MSGNRFKWISAVLICYFISCLLLINFVESTTLQSDTTIGLLRLQSELRPQLWKMLIEAVSHELILGYGWNQVSFAQLSVANNHPNLGSVAAHSHNLFLDFFIWYGLPIGIFISAYLVRWVYRSICAVRCAQDMLLVLFILVVMNHAMLELPLHHGYFLFPVALMVGVLNIRANQRVVFVGRRRGVCVLLFVSLGMFIITAKDYIKIENSYLNLRYEWARIKVDAPRVPPDLLVLNQLGEFVRYARFEPFVGMTDEELRWMEHVVLTYPNSGVLFKYASALALNNKLDLANMWLDRMCKVVHESDCVLVKNAWSQKHSKNEIDPLASVQQ